MHVRVLALAALAACGPEPSAPAPNSAGAPAAHDPATPAAGPHWFAGSWDELLETARERQRLVLVDFWASWCPPCLRLERETFSDASVRAALDELLCYRVDTEQPVGQELAQRFGADVLPTLVVLEPDGTPRDALTGFLDAEALLTELARIRRDEGTVGAARRRAAAAPSDPDAEVDLAAALERVGDGQGAAAALARARELDPTERSLGLRRRAIGEALRPAQEHGDLGPLRAELAVETRPELLFEGWITVEAFERLLAHEARSENDAGGAAAHERAALAARRLAWPHAPAQRRAALGRELAWDIYERRAELGEADLAFGLDVARACVAEAERSPGGADADVLDTLACLLDANGRRDEAIEAAKRAAELEPDEPRWRERLEELSRPR